MLAPFSAAVLAATVLAACCETPPDDKTSPAAIVARPVAPGLVAASGRADTCIRFVSERETTIFDINSRFGIDAATVMRKVNHWPKSILVRLHLKGLESFRATCGDTTVEWSVSSTSNIATQFIRRRNLDSSELDKTSPYYAEVRMVGGDGKIPLKDGYFEVRLPAKLFEENPDAITLRWIDFYRN